MEFRHQPIGAVKARLAALLEGYRALLGPGSLSSNSAPDMSSMKSLAEILPQKRCDTDPSTCDSNSGGETPSIVLQA